MTMTDAKLSKDFKLELIVAFSNDGASVDKFMEWVGHDMIENEYPGASFEELYDLTNEAYKLLHDICLEPQDYM